MADFEKAFLATMGHEGGYVNDPDDAGGETYRGISRVAHPEWPGWALVDRVKTIFARATWNRQLLDQPEVQRHVRAFYHEQYWSKIGGARLEQPLAEVLFDMYVNLGSTIRYLQRTLNVLAASLIVDGHLGPATTSACAALPERDQQAAVTLLRCLRGMHYLERCEAHPDQKKYLHGWLRRVGP